MPRLLVAALLAAFALPAAAQPTEIADAVEVPNLVAPTPGATRLVSFEARQALHDRSLVNNVAFRSVGPTVMSGRVTDVDVSPFAPTTFYVAYASGGLWRTTSGGSDFEPLFDDQAVMTLGDIAVRWNADGDDTIWLGTGENNSSRSSYAGAGIYRSTDGGATWSHLGLEDTEHIGRIVLHPTDPETAWVAALGPLYSPGPDRGVYKTTDGGRTWRKTLFVNDNAGIVDLVIDPDRPDVLWASAWERTRRAWDFTEAGAGSGIYKSADGGESWVLVTAEGSGFPTGRQVGRIGLAVYPGDSETIFASLDNQARRPDDDDLDTPTLTKDALRAMTQAEFLALAEDDLNAYLDRNGFPLSYTAQSLLEMVREGTLEPVALVDYLEDANAQLFDTPVVGAEVYRSDDGGISWTRTHDEFIDDTFFSYGYYFGEIRVAPDDADRLWVLGVPMISSTDGGQTWSAVDADHVHADHHALFVNPNVPGHLVNGNDGGINVSYDGGASWFKANSPAVGQFYTVAVDAQEPYHVYGGLQDNGVWAGPHTHDPDSRGWRASGDYDWDWIMGGDGMQIQVDTRTNNTVYTGFQFGNYFRLDRPAPGAGYESTRITPEHELGERPLRFNWQTPIRLSRHNQDILYLGSQKLHRSLDRGATWEALSDDLTHGGTAGDVPYGTLTTIDESPDRFGLLVVGSDDGRVHVTEDGGYRWTDVSAGLPPNLWVSRVVASAHDSERLYVTLNGYRWDHFDAYVYRSDDLGATWQRLGTDLPVEPVNVIVEDQGNPDLLFVGTDNGLYASLDGGATFMTMMGSGAESGLPNAPVHDAVIHEEAGHLVVGTHGRSIWIADLEHVQQLTPDMRDGGLDLFGIETVQHSEGWGERGWAWGDISQPEARLTYFAPNAGQATLTVTDSTGTLVSAAFDDAERGLNTVTYNLAYDADEVRDDQEVADDGRVYLTPGTYTVTLALGGETVTETLTVEPGPEKPSRGRKKTP